MMFDVFRFRGRLGRLDYVGRSLLSGLIAAIVVALFGIALDAIGPWGGWAAQWLAGAAVVGPVAIAFTWIGFALMTRRLRDAGFNPLIVVPAQVLVYVSDIFVLSRYLDGPVGPYHGSYVGLMVNLVFCGVLLFWPSAGENGHRDEPSHPTATSPVAIAMSPVSKPAGSQPPFGRRRW